MLTLEWILKDYDEDKPKESSESSQKISIYSQTTIAYKIKREDVTQDMFDDFFDDLKRPGVYILFGKTTIDNHEMIYVGQSDNVAKRLYDHRGGKPGEKQNGKTFWTECYAFVSMAPKLHKGNTEYLEYAFYQKASEANRYILDNTNIPTEKNVSLGDKDFCNDFILDCDLLSRLMGHPIFASLEDDSKKTKTVLLGTFEINNSARVGDNDSKYVNATGQYVEKGFTVLVDSIIAKNVTKKASKSIRDMRKDLKKRGYLKEENDKLVFKKEYTFLSPGIAASVVLGRSASAKDWKKVKQQGCESK